VTAGPYSAQSAGASGPPDQGGVTAGDIDEVIDALHGGDTPFADLLSDPRVCARSTTTDQTGTLSGSGSSLVGLMPPVLTAMTSICSNSG